MSNAASIETALEHLRRGAVIAMPTETVYGLAGDALNPLAIRQIYALKGRPAGHPVIVHLAPDADPSRWGTISPAAQSMIDAFWPGPLTLIVPRHSRVPDEVTGGRSTVGIRMPSHPTAQAILTAFGSGLAAPSANRFGRISPTCAAHVKAEFADEVYIVDGGPCAIGVESTIVDTTGSRPAILRSGYVLESAITDLVGPLGTSTTVAPGSLKSHYAPMTSLRVSAEPDAEARRLEEEGLTVAVYKAPSPDEHAQQLYAELRRLDSLGVDVLVAEPAEDTGIGIAINDRLSRAAHRFSTTDN